MTHKKTEIEASDKIPESARWYVVQVKPNDVTRALTNLERQGFETFMPMRLKTIRHARQMKNVLKPIFLNYLFVRFAAESASWRKINSTFGVLRLISFGKNLPTPVPVDLMAGLRARCDDAQILQPLDDLRTGEKVMILSGPFANFVGEIETFIADDCVRLLFEYMGQVTRVDMPTIDLERL